MDKQKNINYLTGIQHLVHIRQDDKWKIGTELNWMQQVHADDDDDVVEKNPIYYALKTIDEEKLKYLGYNFHQDEEYKVQQSRLIRELTSKVYNKIVDMIKLDTEKLDEKPN